jgi:hypothetical protein
MQRRKPYQMSLPKDTIKHCRSTPKLYAGALNLPKPVARLEQKSNS